MNPYGNVKHGGHGTLTYSRWKSMMQRCYDPKHASYSRYGGAGIAVCPEWFKFEEFVKDMGECPGRSMTLDRIKSDRGYEPDNCRWATKADQNRNRPAANVRLTHAGVTQNVTDWARQTGIKADTIFKRIKLGWTADRILTTPAREMRRA